MTKRIGPGRRKRQLGRKLEVGGKKVFAVSKREYLWMRRPKPEKVMGLDKDILVKDRRIKERRSGRDRRGNRFLEIPPPGVEIILRLL